MKKIILNSELTRRSFVKGSALATGGIIAGSTLGIGSSAFGAGKDTLKLAVIGCGGRGTGAVRQALTADEGVELVAMADAFQDRLDNCYDALSKVFDKKRLNVKDDHKFTGFGGYKQAIDLADVVILTTPPGWRPEHFEYAVNQGKHVFIEKPVATDAPGVRRVLAAAKKAKEKKLNVVAGLQRHYQDNYREIYKRLQAGEIGEIRAGQVYWNSGGVWVREREANQTEMEYQMRNWYYFNWLCGDHILEQHIHNIDVANWFIGSTPVTAQGMGGREVRKGKDHGQIFDHHFVEFEYESGAVVASQCRHIQGCLGRVSETFQGTKGKVTTDGGGNAHMTRLDGSEIYRHDPSDDITPYQIEHNELFAAIRKGEVISNGEFVAHSTMTAIMGRMATYSGKLITWEEALNSNQTLAPVELGLTWDSKPPVMPDADGLYPIPVPGQTEVL
ncbi:MAG: Gfo/Idh/MocA family oxidoreductase [Cyclobacteriaceae bacterium]|nr:Gfo/Idh/MocA family oxidoreductase [Cyclobacteriaceae bacterium]